MKKIFLLIVLFLIPSFGFASDFSDLQTICSLSDGTYSAQPPIVLPHIDKKITKANNYIRMRWIGSHNFNGVIFFHANTFTDDYKFIGSYLLEYDCNTNKLKTLTKMLTNKEWQRFPGLAWITNIPKTKSLALTHGWSSNWGYYWIYDIDTRSLRYIKTNYIKAPKGQYVTISPDFESYDWKWINLKVLYYTKITNSNGFTNFNYTNYWNPDIKYYSF